MYLKKKSPSATFELAYAIITAALPEEMYSKRSFSSLHMEKLLKRKDELILLLINMFPYKDFEQQLVSALLEHYEDAQM